MREHLKGVVFRLKWCFLPRRQRYAYLCQRSGFYR
jgi:hypothetical protein